MFKRINNEAYLCNHLRTHAHTEIFSKSYQIKPKSDCIYHFPIDLEQQTESVPSFAVSNQSENG